MDEAAVFKHVVDELMDVLADEYEFGAGKSARQSTLLRGLLRRDGRYTLTD